MTPNPVAVATSADNTARPLPTSKGAQTENQPLPPLVLKNISNEAITLLNEAVQKKGALRPLYPTLLPQLPLPVDLIYNLDKLGPDAYLLRPLQKDLPPKIPVGELSYVVLSEDPTTILCFDHDDLRGRKDLCDKAQGPNNYGHSSLAYKEDGRVAFFDRSLSPEERVAGGAKAVTMSGHLHFSEVEHPEIGGGQLLRWNNESGHYKPTIKQTLDHRFGLIGLLPDHLFKPFEPGTTGRS